MLAEPAADNEVRVGDFVRFLLDPERLDALLHVEYELSGMRPARRYDASSA
jgi:hypothetical protein